ncbi:MAG: DoxX family protein [Actinomycetota bacterium]
MEQPKDLSSSWGDLLSLAGLVGLMTVGGLMHFVVTDKYAAAVPRFLPFRQGIVYASGVVEIACGIALLPRRTRSGGAWLTALVLVLIFPANVQMAIDGPPPGSSFPFNSSAALWLRLPLQAAFIAWAYSFTTKRRPLT